VAAAATHFVSVQEFLFGPKNLTIAAGDTVVWTFDGAVPHTTTGPSWDSGTRTQGQSFSQTFATAGTFDYLCSIHPGSMQAQITVTG
jgi:plastocyanin